MKGGDHYEGRKPGGLSRGLGQERHKEKTEQREQGKVRKEEGIRRPGYGERAECVGGGGQR